MARRSCPGPSVQMTIPRTIRSSTPAKTRLSQLGYAGGSRRITMILGLARGANRLATGISRLKYGG